MPWITCAGFLLGWMALSFRRGWLLPLFLPVAYLGILFAFIKITRVWRDVMNPLSLVIIIGFVRFFVPGLLLLSGAEPPDEIENFFLLMQLSNNDWLWGHALALIGILAVIFGWVLIQPREIITRSLRLHLLGSTKYASIAAMLVGFMALSAFFLMNASIGAILSGSFRGTTVQVGTGKYFFLAYLLIVGSVFLCCCLLSTGYKWISLMPSGIAMLLYWPLGGRGRAVISVLCGMILLWYVNREQKGWSKLTVRAIQLVKALVIGIFIILVFYIGSHYRGDPDERALSSGLSMIGLWSYLKGSVYSDLGQLHSLAGAIEIGPAVLGGQTFTGSLSWPLSEFLPIQGRSAGVYIVEVLVGLQDDHKWGVNATLIGDAYLNFGLWSIPIIMASYGALLKIIYLRFRQGVLHIAIYVLALVYGMQILWGSIEVWPQALTVLCFAFAVHMLGNTVFNLREKSSRSRIAPIGGLQ
ncbi:MAG TPA: O-antigen polymerase [Candidatus Binatia bacterium]|nr:O-antigen polymerase [Candidatus Binatia bacterium]